MLSVGSGIDATDAVLLLENALDWEDYYLALNDEDGKEALIVTIESNWPGVVKRLQGRGYWKDTP